MKNLMPIERVERRIYSIRGQRVMLDSDLAEIYGVSTIRLNEQVSRNRKRFPADFMFQLTKEEADSLRSQIAILETGRGRGKHRKYSPYVFTEHGTVMLSAVLHTSVAIEASIRIARAFVRLREMISSNKELAAKLVELERKIDRKFKDHDGHIRSLFDAIQQLIEQPAEIDVLRRKGAEIGFQQRRK